MRKFFMIAALAVSGWVSAAEMSPAEKFIRENWKNCIRLNTKDEGEHVGLPFPYTCPCASGAFQEMYYWDTYFTNVGLLLSDMTEQAKNNCRNMAYLIRKYGFMPNGNRTYYLNNSQPPFFSRMVRDIYAKTGEKEWIKEMYPAIVIEHKFWQTRRVTKSGLNRYSGEFKDEAAKVELSGWFFKRMNMLPVKDPKAAARWGECYRSFGESGWDCNSRFAMTDWDIPNRFGFNPQDHDWLDLNSLLYGMETDLAFFAKELGNGDEAKWLECAADRKAIMNKVMWDEKLGRFCDHDFLKDLRHEFVSVAQFYPMFTRLATKEQAASTVKLLPQLEHLYGVACSQPGWLLDLQWDYPHGWACLQYVMIQALENYGYHEDALRIARKYVTVVDKVFAETGALWEKYDVVKGAVSVTKEYESPKMLGWSAGVYLFCRQFIGNAFPETPRVVVKLADGWKADGVPVTIPHTWNALDGEDGASEESEKFVAAAKAKGGFYAQYWKWVHKSAASEMSYNRKITVYEHELPDPDPAKRYFFKCDGAAITAEVYVNDKLVGRHNGSYTAFCYDITKFLKPNGNRIGVVVDSRPNRDIPVLCADYTVYGGIYRDCWLIATDTVCIDPTYYGGPGVAIAADAKTGAVKVDVKTLGGESPVTCFVDGKKVGGTEFKVENFELWSPENPKVYDLVVKLDRGDSVTLPFGFRTTGFSETQEYVLNGKARKLRGVNRHQDRPGQGWCVTPEQEEEDISIIKEMGCDALRTAHYAQSQHIYELCDRKGLVVWCEIPQTDTLTPSPAFRANIDNMIREYVAQYGHHPSICMWSLFNELQNCWSANQHADDIGEQIVHVNDLFHELDSTRPTVCAFNNFEGFTIDGVTDGAALNTYPGWYWAETPDITNHIDKCCYINHRTRLGLSEYGSGASINCHAWPLPEKIDAGSRYHPEEFQAIHQAEQYGYIAEAENIWGSFVWIMFDFAADTRDEGEARGINDKGLVTRDRKTRKDAFYFYQANWTDTPVLRLVGTRATEVSAAKVPVVAFSNRKEVTLKVNGKTIATKSPSKFKVVRFDDVALAPGENTIELTAGDLKASAKWRVK